MLPTAFGIGIPADDELLLQVELERFPVLLTTWPAPRRRPCG